jgi:hypothetical protein
MRIKVLFDNKKGSSRFLEENLDFIRGLVEKYPNAFWRKYKSKTGQIGYELSV